MSLALACDYAQLAFHTLAHYRFAGPASLFDAAYCGSCAEEASAPIARDAALVEALHMREPNALALQSLPLLFTSIGRLRASGARDALGPEDVDDVETLERLTTCAPLFELVRVAMWLVAPAYQRTFPAERAQRALAELAPLLDRARAIHPALRDARVELALALGARGRAFADRIVVGAEAPFNAVVAMHEASVRAQRADYARGEWAALIEVARIVERSELEEAHRSWIASLDLEPLCRKANELGLVSPELASKIAADRPARAALLRHSGRT